MQLNCVKLYRNQVALFLNLMTFLCHLTTLLRKDLPTPFFDPAYFLSVRFMKPDYFKNVSSVLAWPAWLRVLAVLPPLVLLWLAVVWAQLEAAPW
jgi:hypothetical protein